MSEADDIRKRLELAKSRRAAAAAAAAAAGAAASASSASSASLPTAPTTNPSTTAASLPPSSALVPAVTAAAAAIVDDETTTTTAATSRGRPKGPVSGDEDPLAPAETNPQQDAMAPTTASSSSTSTTEQRVMVALCSGSRMQDPPHANQAPLLVPTSTQPQPIVIAASSSSVSSAISSSTTTASTRRPTVVLPSIPLPFPTTPDPNVKPDYHSWNGHHFVTGASFVSAMVGSHLRFSSNNSDSRRRDAAEEDDAATLALLQHHDIRDVLSSSRKRGRADDSSSGQQAAQKKLGIDSLSGFVNPAVTSPPPPPAAASAPPSSSASPLLAVPYPRVDTLNPVSSTSAASNNNNSNNTRTLQQDGAPRCHPTRDVESYFTPNGKLSEGVYGVVIRAQENDTGDLAALKQLKSQWFQESQIGFPHFLLREVDVALRLHHPNLAHTKEVLCRVADPANDDAEQKKSGPSTRYDASPKTFPLAYVTGALHQRFFPISASSSSSSALGSTSENHRPATTAPLSIYLSMEYCWKDLKGFLYDTHRNPLLHLSHRNIHPEAPRVYVKKAKCIAKQIFEGLAFLHAHNILHRDLKTSNVLVDATGVVKLCDFGLARFVQRAECLTPTVVTLMYRAPELHLGVVDYDQKMDVWAAGCILAELFLKYPVFHAEDEIAHLERVCEVIGLPDGTAATFPGLFWRQGMAEKLQALTTRNVENRLARLFQPPDDEEMTVAGSPQRSGGGAAATTAAARRRLYRGAHTLPPEGLDLLQQIFQWNPKNRPSAAEVLRHPFFSPESDTAPCSPAELMKPTPFQPSPQTSTLHKSGQDAIALSSPRITSTTTTTTLMTAEAARLAAETILEQEVFLTTPVHVVVAGSPTTTAASPAVAVAATTTFANVGEQKLSFPSPSGGDSKTKGEGATSAGQVGVAAVDGVAVAETDDDDEDEDDRQEQEALRALFGASPTSVGGAAAERELKMRLVMHDESSPEVGEHNEDEEKGKDGQEGSANQAEDVVS